MGSTVSSSTVCALIVGCSNNTLSAIFTLAQDAVQDHTLSSVIMSPYFIFFSLEQFLHVSSSFLILIVLKHTDQLLCSWLGFMCCSLVLRVRGWVWGSSAVDMLCILRASDQGAQAGRLSQDWGCQPGPPGLAVSARFLYNDITNSIFVIDKSSVGSVPLFNQRR